MLEGRKSIIRWSCLMWMLVNLNHLPPSVATNLPGLAVRCHLAMVKLKPVRKGTWGKLAIQVPQLIINDDDLEIATDGYKS